MLTRSEYPILEFDLSRTAKLEPANLVKKRDVPEMCVITFFAEVIRGMLAEGVLTQIGEQVSETVTLPVYKTVHNGLEIGLVQGYVGAAGMAGNLEELIAMGFSKFIVCGGAGVLRRDIQVGRLVVPVSAVRDEGTSYHYAPPSREIECDGRAVAAIEDYFTRNGVPYMKAKTWTTDAIFRETPDKIALRSDEGCVTVEMEAAALFAVSKFRGVILGQMLYGGDDLSGAEWSKRAGSGREGIRKGLVEMSLDICASL